MWAWLVDNIATVAVSLAVCALIVLAIRQMVKARKQNGCASCGGCSSCQYCCYRKTDPKPERNG